MTSTADKQEMYRNTRNSTFCLAVLIAREAQAARVTNL